MYAKIQISGDILVKTGMHIGGSGAFAAIGAVDSPVVKDVKTNLPMIVYFHVWMGKDYGCERCENKSSYDTR